MLSNLTETTTLAATATTFTFTKALYSGAAYTVTVTTSPTHPTQHCTVSSSSGTVTNADISNVEISCTTTPFRIGGTVTGLQGSGLVLRNNGGDDRPIQAAGVFSFTSTVLSGRAYDVTIVSQPTTPWQTCTTATNSGTVTNANITNVAIHCTTDTYGVGGSISGLSSNGSGITLSVIDNATSSTLASALFHNNQSATFSVSSSVSFSLTTTQPTNPWQTCAISHSTGTVTGTAITDVNVTCTTNHYVVGGTVSGTVTGTAITSVAVTCITEIVTVTYPVGGMVSGLVGTGSGITVTLEGTGQSRSFTSTGLYTPFSVLSGASYSITTTHPTNPWQTCDVANRTGTVGGPLSPTWTSPAPRTNTPSAARSAAS